ncbi:MAG: nucleotidyltransferase domain-containing protein [Candidatus Woesearchaeota archaeon]
MDPQTIIDGLREKVTPTTGTDVPERFARRLDENLKANNIRAEVLLGGSFAKGTYLEGDHDVDVFVRFDPRYNDEEMPDLTAKALQPFEGVERVHGSRDYFQLDHQGFSFEVVPVLHVTEAGEARNVTDVSPLHVNHVQRAVKDNPSIASDIRLAKLFCKAAKVYGAESYLNGFSGHVLDNLIIHYGSLLELLRAAAEWPDELFLDPSGQHEDASFLNPAKRAGPLVLLDPIQPERNAAAALSRERYDAFRKQARVFLDHPDESFFTPKPLTKDDIIRHNPDKNVLCYRLQPLEGSKDVAGTKLLKAHEHLVKQAEKEGFTIHDEGFEFDGDKALAFIATEERALPAYREMQGPPTRVEKAAKRFREAHEGEEVTERDGRLYANVKRKHTTLASLFEAVENGSYWQKRVAGAKII